MTVFSIRATMVKQKPKANYYAYISRELQDYENDYLHNKTSKHQIKQ